MTRIFLAFAAALYLLSGCASLKELGTTLGLKGGEEKPASAVAKPATTEVKSASVALPASKGAEPPSPANGRVAPTKPEIFSTKEECLTALRAGLAAPYVPKFLVNRGKKPVGKNGRKAKPAEADMCVFMLTTLGKKWVYQPSGTMFRFEKGAEVPYALDACGNEVYEWAHLPALAPVAAPAPTSPVGVISMCEAKSQTWNFMAWDRGGNMDPSLRERLVKAEREKGYLGPDAASRGLGSALRSAKEEGKAKLSSTPITSQVARLESGRWVKVGEVKILNGSASFTLPREAWGKKVVAVFDGEDLVYPPVDTRFEGKRVLIMSEEETTPRGCDPKYLHVATDKK